MTDDHSLINRVIAGDRHAFRWLIKQHERLVYSVVWKIVQNQEDAEEVCQDVFLKVYDKLPSFKYESKLSTWIAKIAYNQALSYLRKREGLSETIERGETNFKEKFIDSSATPMEMVENTELKTLLNRAIEQLPVHYRTILTLFHLQEMSYPEIVEITGLPEGTVKNYLFRARNLLKEALQKSQPLESFRG